MSTPLVVDMMTDLFTALRTNLGTFDLSDVGGTSRVAYADAGLERLPTTPPWLLFTAPTPKSTYGQAAMGDYQLDGRLEWFGYAYTTALDVQTRVNAALQLAHEVITAVENAHASSSFATLKGRFPVLLMEVADVFADGPELGGNPPYVHGFLTYQAFPHRGI
jgi:hypothetical protein